MNLVAAANNAMERLHLPDRITRAGVAMLVERTSTTMRLRWRRPSCARCRSRRNMRVWRMGRISWN